MLKSNLTEIIFLLDRSGSMAGLEEDTIGGFNAFIRKQGEGKGEVLVTTVLFDDDYEILWNGTSSEKAILTSEDYFVRGCTALLDAVGKTIIEVGSRLSNTKEEDKPSKVIFVITTDGLENASKEFTYEKIRELISNQREKYNWDFIFLGANIEVGKEADKLGIERKDAVKYEASSEGIEIMYCRVCEIVEEKRA